MADVTDLSPDPAAFPGAGWAAGTRVRLADPENPRHPRAGRVGVVLWTRWFDPVYRWKRGLPDQLVDPATWWVKVRFPPAGDAWDIVGDWSFFGRELAREDG